MKNVSDKLKNIIEKGGLFYAYAKVLFADGTEITLDSEDDFSISDNGYSESGGDDLPLGSALSKTITLSLFNEDGRFSDYDFFYSQITLYTEADLEDGTQERINEGVFYVTSPVATGEVIEITAYDAMYKANKEFTSQLSYPATTRNLLLEVCAFVGITAADAHFKNEDFQIQSMPEKTTARKIIGYIAQIAVGNAIIKNGSLSIKSYDFEPLKDVTDGTLYTELSTQNAKYHVLSEYSDYPTVGMNPVTITGIRTTKRVNNEDVEYLNGTDDYALTITNPLITGAEEKALELIGGVLNGVTLTSFSGTFFPYPTAEIMDCAVIVDQNDKAYKTVITTHDFSYPGESELSCGIKDPETNSSTYYSESAEMYHKAQAEANKNRKEMESAIENLQTTLANAKGMYTSKVKQSDGSYITYLHDKPTMSESENVIKITSDAVGVSTDGGQTYPYGFFLTGDLVAKVLYAIGINADYINTGALTIRDKDGNITFYADTETGRVDIRAKSLAIGGQTLEAIANIAVKKFVDNVYTKDINNLKDQVTNKIETWYQPTDPAVNWGEITEIPWCDVDGNAILDIDGNEMYLYFEETKASHIGDLWKNTTTNEEYRYSESGEWVKMPVPDAVFDEIDGKAQIFINTPAPPYDIGDLWTQGKNGDLMRCKVAKASGAFVTTDWEKAVKYTDDSAVDELDEALTQENIFNRLTNNGQVQGLFLKDGKIYLNFSYAEGGTLKLGGKANEQGTLEVYHSAGWKSLSVDNKGLKTYGGQPIISYIDGVDSSGEYEKYVKLQGGVSVFTNRTNGQGVAIDPDYIGMWDDTGTQVADFQTKYSWWIHKDLSITGDFSVTGKKSRAVNTKSYSKRLLNAYETPAPMFGDVGEGTIGYDGKCYISIDPIFLETIASGCKYQVFLQKNGKGDVWVSERHETYFVVEGTESLNFSWEIKARQKDYEYDRIDVYNENVEERDIDYAYIGEMEYQNYVDTMQAEV